MKETLHECKSDEELIREIRSGNGKCVDYLIDKYKWLVKKKARTLYLIGGDSDDLIQEGMIGIFKAVRDFDPEKNAAFATFADICITRQIYTAVKASQRLKHSPLNSYISLNSPAGEKSEESAPLGDMIDYGGNPEDMLIDRESADLLLNKLKDQLSPLESDVFQLYIEGINYSQISEKLNVKQKSVDNALQRVKNKVLNILEHS